MPLIKPGIEFPFDLNGGVLGRKGGRQSSVDVIVADAQFCVFAKTQTGYLGESLFVQQGDDPVTLLA